MRRLKVGCLPVVDDDRLVGIVTEEDFMDIASKMLEDQLSKEGPDRTSDSLDRSAVAAAKATAPSDAAAPDDDVADRTLDTPRGK
jgi:Mg/Co/Ni transporter MgtE